jgi:hypothetical protein
MILCFTLKLLFCDGFAVKLFVIRFLTTAKEKEENIYLSHE